MPTQEALNKYFGFYKCTVTVPEGTLTPLLPARDTATGSLYYPVGKPITGLYFSEEVALFASLGYTIELEYA